MTAWWCFFPHPTWGKYFFYDVKRFRSHLLILRSSGGDKKKNKHIGGEGRGYIGCRTAVGTGRRHHATAPADPLLAPAAALAPWRCHHGGKCSLTAPVPSLGWALGLFCLLFFAFYLFIYFFGNRAEIVLVTLGVAVITL